MAAATSINDLKFKALNNALYHTARRQRLETWSRVTSFFVIVAGTATVVDLVKDTGYAPWIGLAIAAIGAAQLVFDFAGRAKNHELLQKRYYDLLGRMHETLAPTDEQCASMMAEILRISGEEPPTYRALDAVTYNEALDSIYGDERSAYRLRIEWWQSLTRHVIPYNGTAFRTEAESKPA
jgi:hypothetical protein